MPSSAAYGTFPEGFPKSSVEKQCWRSQMPVRRQCNRLQASRTEYVAGIDLGTTNSCIAVTSGKDIEVIELDDDGCTIPSVVSYLSRDETLVGMPAKKRARKDPTNTFYSSKRFIGRQMDAVKHDAERVAFEVVAGVDGCPLFKCSIHPEGQVSPVEIAAKILKALLSVAEQETGLPVQRAVISVPAYFEDAQREATIAAGKLAGLQNIKLIKEPIAAALAYGLNTEEEQTVMVLDLGGGTFDVSILEIGDGVAEVLSTGGDDQLGGDDWDDAIVKWLATQHLAPAGVSWRDPFILGNLKAMAEIAKIKLSTQQQVALRIPVRTKDGQPIQATLSQQELTKITAHLFERLQLPINACCWQAGVSLEDLANENKPQKGGRKSSQREPMIRPKMRPPISKVLLVGGATRMPIFRKFVENMTGITPDPSLVDPDLAVGIGAAIHAGSLQDGDSAFSHHEVMEPLKRALLNALATQKLQSDDQLAQDMLGDEYEDFREQSSKADTAKNDN